METVPVLGVRVAACNFDDAILQFQAWAENSDRARGVSFADVHVIARARHEQEFGRLLGKMEAIMPDGFPVLRALNRRLAPSRRLERRVSGPDVFRRFHELAQENTQIRHFYLGGSDKLLASLMETARANSPGINIAGSYSPPFRAWSEADIEEMRQRIRDSNANIVWVGLGCPKQELWVTENLETLPPALYMTVGAAFAFYAGSVQRAPQWMQNWGIEWMHRIASEPRRLLKRYLVYNSLFLYYSFRDKIVPFNRASQQNS